MSRLFYVVLEDFDKQDAETLQADIEESYPDNFALAQRGAFLIDADATASDVAEELGFHKDDDKPAARTGVVFSINGQYSGYSYKKLWSWLRKHPAPPDA